MSIIIHSDRSILISDNSYRQYIINICITCFAVSTGKRNFKDLFNFILLNCMCPRGKTVKFVLKTATRRQRVPNVSVERIPRCRFTPDICCATFLRDKRFIERHESLRARRRAPFAPDKSRVREKCREINVGSNLRDRFNYSGIPQIAAGTVFLAVRTVTRWRIITRICRRFRTVNTAFKSDLNARDSLSNHSTRVAVNVAIDRN